MTERMLLKDYFYCDKEDTYQGQNCTELQNRKCMCSQVYELNQKNTLRAQYGYPPEEWFDWEPLVEAGYSIGVFDTFDSTESEKMI